MPGAKRLKCLWILDHDYARCVNSASVKEFVAGARALLRRAYLENA